jgi:type I restriction enzyme M protein
LIEAIIALPTDLFYNTNIGIYAFILSKNKRKERRGKIQLINAVNNWKPLRKSLGKKRREISRDDMKVITEVYAAFDESKDCKIFDSREFMYKEFSVYQPLQRNYAITKERIQKLIDDGIISETDDKCIIESLEKNISENIYNSRATFTPILLKTLTQLQDKRFEKIIFGLSEMDKSAEIQKDKDGKIIYDSTTKDIELIKLTDDIDGYFKREVYPHVPDAHYVYEYGEAGKINLYPSKQSAATLKKEKIGAELPFTRFFYEYKPLEDSDVLLARFFELEKSVTERVKGL